MRKFILFLTLFMVMAIGLNAQDFYDPDTVNEIRIYFTEANWDQILDNLCLAGQEERLVGTAVINGVTYDSVGVRYKGNSSYNPTRLKNPFNIKLDYIINGQTIGPYGTLRLSNGFNDPTLVRENLGYEIARKYFPAPRSNYANIYVNDVLLGVYTSNQDPDDWFGEEHFFEGDYTRIKGEISAMTPWTIWGYVDDNPASYTDHYELDSGDSMMPFINFLNIFNNNPNMTESVLNVDRHLWFLAFENLFVNLDSPINNGQNYYAYEDINHRFNPVPWDLNECFGGFTNMQTIGPLNLSQMQTLDPLINITHPMYPILGQVLNVPLFRRMYIAHMRTMIEENITNNWYYNRALELQSICGPSVQADPNFFFSYLNFINNINTTINGTGGNPRPVVGITELMNQRGTWLLNNNAFQGAVPTIQSPVYSPSVVQPNSTLNLTVAVTEASTVLLGWRQGHTLPFLRVPMFDDGLHGDGAAGDGTWGINLNIGVGDVEYYIYAENGMQGRFLPVRAEYEFLTIPVEVIPAVLFINEIMAKNTTFPDEAGETDDWAELYNPGDAPVDIGGMYLTDDHYALGIAAWTRIPDNVPVLTTIPPHGFLVLWFDEDLAQGPLHVNTKLGAAGDAVYLINTDAVTLIDSFAWDATTGLDTDDVSIGRNPDGSGQWQLFGAGQPLPSTPGMSNATVSNEDETTPPEPARLEAYPNPARGVLNIEVKNASVPVKVKIYNLKGQLVRSLTVNPGVKTIWDGKGADEKAVGNGIYFCRAETKFPSPAQRFVLLR